jgi:hypothetical protein
MTSFRQFDANRRNARKSTGPNTAEGKQRPRYNALRHGLAAETVIGPLENAEDYKAFEATIIADYDAQSAVERQLVLRLAGLLWRLRRATIMETGLFEIQADHLRNFDEVRQIHSASRDLVYSILGNAASVSFERESVSRGSAKGTKAESGTGSKPLEPTVDSAAKLARCFLRVANLPNNVFDRHSRYEVALWRQVGQLLFALDTLDRRKPQERNRCASIESRQASPYAER